MVLDYYIDVYFAGLWNENPQDHISDSIRTAFVAYFANCLILWVSNINTEMYLSILYYEYVAFYHSSRTLNSPINEVIDKLGIDIKKMEFLSNYYVYEENNGAIVVLTNPRMTPTAKKIYIKYHLVQSECWKGIFIWKIESVNQKADIFTKDLQGDFCKDK